LKQVGKQPMSAGAKELKAERGHIVEMKEAGRGVQACVPLATGRAAK
jgi:hypothetical protein